MNAPAAGKKPEDCLYGAVTVGERGQIVIPAEARRELGISPGDRLLVVRHPGNSGLMLFRPEAVRQFMAMVIESIDRAEHGPPKEPHDEPGD